MLVFHSYVSVPGVNWYDSGHGCGQCHISLTLDRDSSEDEAHAAPVAAPYDHATWKSDKGQLEGVSVKCV